MFQLVTREYACAKVETLTWIGKYLRIAVGITASVIGISIVAWSMYNIFCERQPEFTVSAVGSSNYFVRTLAMVFAITMPAVFLFGGWEWVKAGFVRKHAEFEDRVGSKIYDDIDDYERVDGVEIQPDRTFAHAGEYFAWAASVDLLNPDINEDVKNVIDADEASGAEILINAFNGCLSSELFTPDGNQFTHDYYSKYYRRDVAAVANVLPDDVPNTAIDETVRKSLHEILNQRYRRWKAALSMDVAEPSASAGKLLR